MLTPDQQRQAYDLYDYGLSEEEIAQRLHLSLPEVLDYVKELERDALLLHSPFQPPPSLPRNGGGAQILCLLISNF